MSTWGYTFVKTYDLNSAGDLGASEVNGQLTDGDGGNTFFDLEETILGGTGAVTSGTFDGTYDALGVTWVAIRDADELQFFGTPAPGTTVSDVNSAFPGSLDSFSELDNTGGFTTCFAAGTLIATPAGERAVERLAIGDLVTAADGRSVPVKWIGRQTLHKAFTPPERFVPVRVTAGSLGAGLPHTDLVLTAEHALFLDGLAINAGALVNGMTIRYDPVEELPDRVTYYHVETEDHQMILANGAAAETYIDYVRRRAFDNYQEYLDLYGEEKTIREMDLPRVSAARLVPPHIRSRLETASAA